MYFYREPQADDFNPAPTLQQGDILSPIPFLSFSVTKALVVVPDDSGKGDGRTEEHDLTLESESGKYDQLLTLMTFETGIILNQSCDLTGRSRAAKPLLVAQVQSWLDIGWKPQGLSGVLSRIKELNNPKRTPVFFYLPEYKGQSFSMPKSVANLLRIGCYSPEDIGALAAARWRLRLSEPALISFQQRLAYCFGRYGAPDHLAFNVDEWHHEKQQT